MEPLFFSRTLIFGCMYFGEFKNTPDQEEQNNNNYTGLREMQAMYKSPSFAIHLSRQQLINTFSLATAKKSKSHLQMIR